MAFTELNINEITEYGKKAVVELKNSNFLDFEEFAENGFNIFPKSIENIENDEIKFRFRDLGYRYIKMVLKGHLSTRNFEIAKKWLDRLVEFDNNIGHLFDREVGFYCGQYFYETENFDEAYKYWREVVRQSGNNRKRYFEGENPKYWEFYCTQKKSDDKK